MFVIPSNFVQGQNSIFALRLDDVSELFDVEPKLVTGSSQISIRVANATIDFENPNQRKFIVLIIAEETKTKEKLSSTATLTVTVTDANDNRPVFDQESYSISVSETAPPGYSIASITAKDQDSGQFGTNGIRYSLSGTGSELFNVDEITGVLSVADCPRSNDNGIHNDNDIDRNPSNRDKRQAPDDDQLYDMNGKKVNLTFVSQTGLIDPEQNNGNDGDDDDDAPVTTEIYYTFSSSDEQDRNRYTYDTKAPTTYDNDYLLFTGESDEDYGYSGGANDRNKNNQQYYLHTQSNFQPLQNEYAIAGGVNSRPAQYIGPGKAPCLDYETQSVYFLSYKVQYIYSLRYMNEIRWHISIVQ